MPDERTEAQSDDSAVRAANKTWPARENADERDFWIKRQHHEREQDSTRHYPLTHCTPSLRPLSDQDVTWAIGPRGGLAAERGE